MVSEGEEEPTKTSFRFIQSLFFYESPLETGYGVYARACVWARVCICFCML